MALTRIVAKQTEPTEIDEYIFHIVKLYAMLKTDTAAAKEIFSDPKAVCNEIERNFSTGRITLDSFRNSPMSVEFYLKGESLVWRSITIDAISVQLAALTTIVKDKGSRCVALEEMAEKLPQLFRVWNAKGPLSPLGAREKYFNNPLVTAKASWAISARHGVISSESTGAESATGAPKSAPRPMPASALEATTPWCLCCCSRSKPEELTAASPLVSPK
jgi:hypothetical protein